MNAIYVYSLVRALYDEGNDYIDTFIPIVISVIPNDGRIKKNTLQSNIKDKYSLFIPLYSLDVILTRAKRHDYLNKDNDIITLTEAGIELKSKADHYRDVERKINELAEDASEYIKDRTTVVVTNVSDLIMDFVQSNLSSFDILLTSEPDKIGTVTKRYPVEVEQHLADYFILIENNKPHLFAVLQDIILGSIISVSVYSTSFGELNKKFESTIAFLDTNFILSLFDLRQEAFSKPVIELYDLMVESKCFTFKIFDFTIDEVVTVLNRFIRDGRNYVQDFPVDSIYSKLKSLGWTPSYVTEFISKLDEELLKKNIFVTNTNIDLKKYEFDTRTLDELSVYKRDQPELSKKHDLLAIDKIKELRAASVRKIEKAKVIFLTCDIRLANYNFETSHKGKGTINEVIPDRVLTNLLWIKKPRESFKISIPSVISIYKSDQFINYSVWDKFIKIVKSLRSKGSVTDGDIGILLYDRHLANTLKDYSKGQLGQIDEDFVLERIQEAKQQELGQRKVEQEKLQFQHKSLQKKVFEKVLELETLKASLVETRNTIDEAYTEKEEILLKLEERMLEIKSNINTKCESIVNYATITIKAVLVLLVVYLTVRSMSYVISNWNTLEPILALLNLSTIIMALIIGIKRKYFVDIIERIKLKIQKSMYRDFIKRNELLSKIEIDLKEFRIK